MGIYSHTFFAAFSLLSYLLVLSLAVATRQMLIPCVRLNLKYEAEPNTECFSYSDNFVKYWSIFKILSPGNLQ